MDHSENRIRSLGEKRERWIAAQKFESEQAAEAARLAFNQGAIEALHHQGSLAMAHRPRPAALIAGLCTQPVRLHTRGVS